MAFDAACFRGQQNIGGFVAVQRVVALYARDFEMFAVIKLPANQPAIGNHRLRHGGRAVL